VELPFLCTAPETPPPPAFQLYNDDVTGFTFGQWNIPTLDNEDSLYYRIAIPDTAQEAPYDAVIQFQAPNSVGWAGLAWGGVMRGNPLTVAWPNCSNVVISSRWTK
jgi:Cytochrome domain of cellobiose dehydrogenase